MSFYWQGSRRYLKDDTIVINFNRLPDKHKNLDDADDIKSKQQDLNSNINKLDATLSRIPAPNMKAVTKYDTIKLHIGYYWTIDRWCSEAFVLTSFFLVSKCFKKP